MARTRKDRLPPEPTEVDSSEVRLKARVAGGLLLLVALAGVYWILLETGVLATLTNEAALRQWIHQLGYWGPVGIVGLMILAIVMSPIPSAPIGMAAGAVYGSLWGTTLVVIGSEAGALIAFMIARFLGYDAVHRWRRVRPVLAWLGRDRSQNGLMLVVFGSRLMPFISFDAVSYAAGLTPLAFWRFLIATLMGIIPASYLIASLGGLLMANNSRLVAILVVLTTGITLVPIIAALLFSRHHVLRKGPRPVNKE